MGHADLMHLAEQVLKRACAKAIESNTVANYQKLAALFAIPQRYYIHLDQMNAGFDEDLPSAAEIAKEIHELGLPVH